MACTTHFHGSISGTVQGWNHDFRIVSALYLIFRIAVLLRFLGKLHSFNNAFGWLTTAVVLVTTSLFFAIVRPYKVNYFNAIDSIILALLALQSLIGQFIMYLPNQRYSHAIGIIGLLIMGIPHATLVLCILFIVLKKFGSLQCLKGKCQCLLSMVCWKEHSLAKVSNGHG